MVASLTDLHIEQLSNKGCRVRGRPREKTLTTLSMQDIPSQSIEALTFLTKARKILPRYLLTQVTKLSSVTKRWDSQ